MDQRILPVWRVDLPPAERRRRLLADLDGWIRSTALARLADLWNARPPSTDSTGELFDWYADLANGWEFRQGRERDLARTDVLGPEQREAVLLAASDLGLTDTRGPSRPRYDFTVVLGGLVRACVTRPRYARELQQQGVDLGQVVAVGGFRAIGEKEHALASRLGIEESNEFFTMVAGMRRAFDLSTEPIVTGSFDPVTPDHQDWARAAFAEAPVEVLAGPSRDPGRRANTADTLAWWAAEEPDFSGSSVLVITTAIYVPYQGAVAIETLGIPYDVRLDTVGISASAADLGPDTLRFSGENYLQEIRSAIRGYRSLHDSVRRMA